MKMPLPVRLCLGFAVVSCACQLARAADSAGNPPYVTQVFGLTKLHRIEIVVPAADLVRFLDRNAQRVRGTISFDGTTLRDIGVRQQGGTWLPYVGINSKPSLSLKFNEFTKGQELFGLKKLILKNQAQDRSLLNEHLTYEVFVRAGQPAPLTAYAQVKINGIDQGIYLLREPINQQFLARHFGKDRDGGNLYEIVQDIDPMKVPNNLNLKDEVEEHRSREDVRAFAAAVRPAMPETFARLVAPYLDLDRFITFFALETATSHADGYTNNTNNTYLYHVPEDDRFWDQTALLARVEQVARLLATATPSARVTQDVAKFERQRPLIETFIRNGGTTGGTGNLPR